MNSNLKPLISKRQNGATPHAVYSANVGNKQPTESVGEGTQQDIQLKLPVLGFDIHDESSQEHSEMSVSVGNMSKGFKNPINYVGEKGGADNVLLEVPLDEYLTSDLETTINILNNIIGCGTLALPYCIAVSGLSAFICYFFVGYICIYGAKVIAKLMYDENGMRTRFTFFDISQHAFGHNGSQAVRYLQIIQLVCSTSSFLILAAQVATAFVQRNFPLVDNYGYDIYNSLVVIIGIVFFFLSMFMARLKNLAILSILGGFNSLTCISCVVMDCLIFNENTIPWKENFFDYPFYIDIHGFIICNGILLSSFMFHHQVTHHVAEMQNPDKVQSIFNLAGCIVLFMKIIMIGISFGTFGGSTEEIVILNLQNTTLRLVSSFCIIIDKLMTFPLYFYTIRMIPEGVIYSAYPKLRNDNQEIRFYISLPIRVFIMGLIIATCILFRHISTIMAFSSCIMIFFEIIIPCSCMLLRSDASIWDTFHCSLLVPLGVAYFLGGSYVNFYYLFHAAAA